MKPTIVLDAAPFCYGPISTLLSIVDHLPHDELDLVLLASGTAAEFAAPYADRFRIVPCNTEEVSELEHHRGLIERSRLFISNTNPAGARFAAMCGTPTIYVDTLFWMWDEIDPVVAGSTLLYVAQDFDGIEENYRRLGGAIEDFRVVGPLINTSVRHRSSAENSCVISFGGMESSLTKPGETNNYPWLMTEILLAAFSRSARFDRHLFRGRGPVMEQLALEHEDVTVDFRFVPHERYLEEIGGCRLHLLSPGLTGAYEAAALNVPTVLLLPQNYSQQLQAETFLANPGWRFAGYQWSDIYPDVEMRRYMPEAEAIAMLNDVIRRFESDTVAHRRYADMLDDAIERTLCREAGGTAMRSGAGEVAAMVVDVLAERHAPAARPAFPLPLSPIAAMGQSL